MSVSGRLLNVLGIESVKSKKTILSVIDILLHCLATKKSFIEAVLLIMKEHKYSGDVNVKELETVFTSLELLKLAHSSNASSIFLLLMPTYKNHRDWRSKSTTITISVIDILKALGYNLDYKMDTFRGLLSRIIVEINYALDDTILAHRYDKDTHSYIFTFISAKDKVELRDMLLKHGNVNINSIDKYNTLFDEKNPWK